jgi:hypothetical protein
MRSARLRLLPVLTGLGLLGVLGGGWRWWQGAPPAAGEIPGPAEIVLTSVRRVHFEANARPATNGPAPTAAEPGRAQPVLELPADEAAQFAALCDLRLLAADTELDLSHREWAALSALLTETQQVRLAYEAEIAQVAEVAPGRHRIEIPAYAEAGDELRRRFHAELRAVLGDAVADEVREKFGAKLDALFAGFGVSTQTLEIVGDPARAPAGIRVERTARFWNSAAGGERVTTRRDVQFPTAADPATEAWQPLLALLGKTE